MSAVSRAFFTCLLAGLLAVPLAALADEKPKIATKEEVQQYIDKKTAQLHLMSGTLLLPGEFITLTLPEEFGYLRPPEAEILLHDIWGNPPAKKTYGVIIPAPLDIASSKSWAIKLNYTNEGHVSDEDAEKINSDEILKEMQEATEKANAQRKEKGYPAVHLVGWAEKPFYDKKAHKLYWAKEFVSDNSPDHILNYDVRVLGREGVLVMSIIGSMDQLPMIHDQRDKILSFVNFNERFRYQDFNGATDRTAAYGIAALIAGGLATKVGIFKYIVAVLLLFKKFILIGVLGGVAFTARLLGRKKKQPEEQDAP